MTYQEILKDKIERIDNHLKEHKVAHQSFSNSRNFKEEHFCVMDFLIDHYRNLGYFVNRTMKFEVYDVYIHRPKK